MSCGEILVLIFLSVNSVIDIWKKRISVLSIGIYILIWCITCMAGCDVIRILVSMLPGILLLLVSVMSKGAVGMGDGFIVLGTGLCLMWSDVVMMVAIAFFLAFIWAVFQISIYKDKGRIFPFVPFLLLGYLVVLII